MKKYFFVFLITLNTNISTTYDLLPLKDDLILDNYKKHGFNFRDNYTKKQNAILNIKNDKALLSKELENFIKLLNSQDQCALIRTYSAWTKLPLKTLINVMLEIPDFLPPFVNTDDRIFAALLKALTTDNAEEALILLGSFEDESLKFNRALLLGGMLSKFGISKTVSELELSIHLLEQLKLEDPNNGAYPFFLASIKKAANRSQNEVDQEFYLALRAKKFNTHITEISQRIWSRGLRNPNFKEFSKEIIHYLNIPDYRSSNRLMHEYLRRNENEHLPAISFGKLLMQNGLDSKNREFIYWIALEYQIGFRKLDLVVKHNPKFKDRIKGYELDYKQFGDSLSYYLDQNFWDDAVDNSKPCPTNELLIQLKKDIDYFVNYLQSEH